MRFCPGRGGRGVWGIPAPACARGAGCPRRAIAGRRVAGASGPVHSRPATPTESRRSPFSLSLCIDCSDEPRAPSACSPYPSQGTGPRTRGPADTASPWRAGEVGNGHSARHAAVAHAQWEQPLAAASVTAQTCAEAHLHSGRAWRRRDAPFAAGKAPLPLPAPSRSLQRRAGALRSVSPVQREQRQQERRPEMAFHTHTKY